MDRSNAIGSRTGLIGTQHHSSVFFFSTIYALTTNIRFVGVFNFNLTCTIHIITVPLIYLYMLSTTVLLLLVIMISVLSGMEYYWFRNCLQLHNTVLHIIFICKYFTLKFACKYFH